MHRHIVWRQFHGAVEQRQALLFARAIGQPRQETAPAAHDLDMPAAERGDREGVAGIVLDCLVERRLAIAPECWLNRALIEPMMRAS